MTAEWGDFPCPDCTDAVIGYYHLNNKPRTCPYDGMRVPSLRERKAARDLAERVSAEADRMRVRDLAHEQVEAERHARTWRPPADHGSLTDELGIPDDGPQWRLRGLLGVGHNAVLVASRKAGKTTVVSNLIRAYVDEEPFLGRFEVEPTPAAVAVFNYEVDERQYRRWLRESGILKTDRVHVLHLRGRTLPLKDARVRAWVTGWLRDRGVGLWVVDPYSRAYVGSLDNGNDEAQVGAFLDTLDVIKRDAGVSELVMPVHTPKARAEAGEETAIGSQRLEGWPDSMWYLTRDLTSGSRFLRAEGRDVDVDEQQLTYDKATRRLTLGGWDRATVTKRKDADDVVTYVSAHPGASQNAIELALGWGVARVRKALGVAATANRLRIESGPNNSRRHFAQVLHFDLEHPGAPSTTG